MQKFLFAIDHLSTWVGKLFAWTILALTFVVAYEVFMRYFMRSPTGWAYDTAYILYGTLFMMAGAYALSRNAHVRADVVMRHAPTRVQAGLDLLLYLLFFFPAVLALIYFGYDFAHHSWRIGEGSAFSPRGPPVWPLKAMIPLSAVFLLIQGVAEVTRCVMCLRWGSWPDRLDDVRETDAAAVLKDAERLREAQP